ncbi:MAG: hypothetical protein U0470_11340 [Anaerolineae bacterium]
MGVEAAARAIPASTPGDGAPPTAAIHAAAIRSAAPAMVRHNMRLGARADRPIVFFNADS